MMKRESTDNTLKTASPDMHTHMHAHIHTFDNLQHLAKDELHK